MIFKSYTTAQATRIAGFKSPMMVEYLYREGVVVPSIRANPGRGRSCLYNFGDLVLLRTVRRLLESKLPVSKLTRALDTLRKKFSELGPESEIARYLITDGKNVLLHNNPSHLVELNKDGQLAFAFIVDIHDARADISADISKFSRKAAKFPKEIRRKKRSAVT